MKSAAHICKSLIVAVLISLVISAPLYGSPLPNPFLDDYSRMLTEKLLLDPSFSLAGDKLEFVKEILADHIVLLSSGFKYTLGKVSLDTEVDFGKIARLDRRLNTGIVRSGQLRTMVEVNLAMHGGKARTLRDMYENVAILLDIVAGHGFAQDKIIGATKNYLLVLSVLAKSGIRMITRNLQAGSPAENLSAFTSLIIILNGLISGHNSFDQIKQPAKAGSVIKAVEKLAGYFENPASISYQDIAPILHSFVNRSVIESIENQSDEFRDGKLAAEAYKIMRVSATDKLVFDDQLTHMSHSFYAQIPSVLEQTLWMIWEQNPVMSEELGNAIKALTRFCCLAGQISGAEKKHFDDSPSDYLTDLQIRVPILSRESNLSNLETESEIISSGF